MDRSGKVLRRDVAVNFLDTQIALREADIEALTGTSRDVGLFLLGRRSDTFFRFRTAVSDRPTP
jgi:hypothetical protein